jgi:predicted PurR-regulated permease PerM
MLALALTIVFHPLRQKLERRLPGWAASITLLICAYVLILTLTLALVVSVGRLGELVSTYGQEADDAIAQIADGLEASGVGSEQVDAVADALDVGQLVDLTTSLMSSVLSVCPTCSSSSRCCSSWRSTRRTSPVSPTASACTARTSSRRCRRSRAGPAPTSASPRSSG